MGQLQLDLRSHNALPQARQYLEQIFIHVGSGGGVPDIQQLGQNLREAIAPHTSIHKVSLPSISSRSSSQAISADNQAELVELESSHRR